MNVEARPYIEAVARQLWANMRARGAVPWGYDEGTRRQLRFRAPYRREAAAILRVLLDMPVPESVGRATAMVVEALRRAGRAGA